MDGLLLSRAVRAGDLEFLSGVAVRAGTHCVMPLLARFGVSATCRASFAMYNTREEIDCLAEALIKAQGFFS